MTRECAQEIGARWHSRRLRLDQSNPVSIFCRGWVSLRLARLASCVCRATVGALHNIAREIEGNLTALRVLWRPGWRYEVTVETSKLALSWEILVRHGGACRFHACFHNQPALPSLLPVGRFRKRCGSLQKHLATCCSWRAGAEPRTFAASQEATL